MYRRLILGSFLTGLLFSLPVSAAEEEGARELVRRVKQKAIEKTSKATVVLEQGSEQRVFEIRRMGIPQGERVHILVDAPFHYKGMRYVFEEDAGEENNFSYLPALRRTVRVASDARSQPFLMTDFYLEDMIPPVIEKFDYEVVGEDTIGGRRVRLVESRSRRPDFLYGKTILAIDPSEPVTVETRFFDADGDLLKTWTVERFERIDGQLTAVEQTMKAASDEEPWRLRIEEIRYGVDFTADDFSPHGL